MCDGRKFGLINRTLQLKTKDPVQPKVRKDLLSRLERFETVRRTSMLSNQPTTEAVKTLHVDLNNFSSNKAR